MVQQRSEFENNRSLREAANQLYIPDLGASNSLRVKGDFKPEIFFLGQIVGGTDFPTDQDGIFVEASLKYGENWKPATGDKDG